MKKIILAPNPLRDVGLAHTERIRRRLETEGTTPLVFPLEYVSEERIEPVGRELKTLTEALADARLLVALGGDGTILHLARIAAPYRVPILTVNLGRKGFIAELEPEDVDEIAKIAVESSLQLEERMMINVTVTRDGATVYQGFALNDAVVKGVARLVDFAVFGDGHLISRFSGDGVVICTPTGSTAYSMASGGPIIEPTARNITVTPICAHALRAKSFVLAPERTVTVQSTLEHGKQGFLSVDGSSFPLEDQDEVCVTRSRYVTRLVKATGRSFYQIVNEKLGEN